MDTNLLIYILLAIIGGEKVLKPIADKFGIKFPSFGNGRNGIPEKNNIPDWAKQLQQHFNEHTTVELEKMNTLLTEIKDENIKHHAIEEGKFNLLQELIKK